MRILVAPLNWGLGHASRCVPLVHKFMAEGNEVILGGDGDSLTLLRRHFPQLRYVHLASLQLRYSSSGRQVWAMIKSLPRLIIWSLQDHAMLRALLREEKIDRVVSDNRFGLYSEKTDCIYITHQLHIRLPRGWRWAEGIAMRLHARIYNKYNAVWVPDYAEEGKSLSGELGHLPPERQKHLVSTKIEYISPLSRFAASHQETATQYGVVCVLSGLEPQRSLLEKELLTRFSNSKEHVLIIEGLMGRPKTQIKRGAITIVPYMDDADMQNVLLGAKKIIARSGYSMIMDLDALGVLSKAELIPTPGQPEQEYLAHRSFQRDLQ